MRALALIKERVIKSRERKLPMIIQCNTLKI